MTNVSMIASHQARSTGTPFNGRESSNDIDNVIETIERLRLASRQGSSDQPEKTRPDKHPEESRPKLTFNNIDDNDYKRDSADFARSKTANLDRKSDCNIRSDDQKGATDCEHGHSYDDTDSSDDDLIERSPTKNQNLKCSRSQPYQNKIEQLDPFLEKVTGQIMRDKECRKILEPCLESLSKLQSYYDDNQNDSQAYDANADVTVTTIDNAFANESLILENVLNNAFQVPQRMPDNFLISQKRTEDSECLLRNCNKDASGSESHSSSPALSPVSGILTNSPKQFTLTSQNFGFSEVASVSSPYRSIPSLSSYPSDYSPSSSTQSYGEVPSPASVRSSRTSIGSQISERFDDLSRSKNDYDLIVAGNPVPNPENTEWSMDEFLKSLDGENEKVDQSRKQDCSNAAIEGYNQGYNVFRNRDNEEGIKTFSPERNVDKEIRTTDFEDFFLSNYLRDGQIEAPVINDRYSFPATLPVTNVATAKIDNYQLKGSNKVIGGTDRNAPWSSLHLPTMTKASERLMEKLDLKKVEKAMASLLKISPEKLKRQDNDGDTELMCLVGNPVELDRKLAYLIPFVDRLCTIPGALAIVNNRGEDALYVAALNCPHMPFVAGYLAATMIEKGIDVSQRLYRRRGDTLIHSIAAQGDSHKEVLEELLALTTVQGNCVFDLTKRNYDGKTALHVAIESHDPVSKGVTSTAIVRLLLKYGADPSIKETKCGDSALHMAVSLGSDPAIVKLLLGDGAVSLVNATNYYLNTPLHSAAANSNIPLEKQLAVCSLLVHAGSQVNVQNRHGKTPLALASSERKEPVRKILHRRP